MASLTLSTATPLDFADALQQSREDFERHIRPLAERVLRGKIEVVEGAVAYASSEPLDAYAGVDLWIVRDGHGVRGIGNRVQRGPRNWRTFTVRKSRSTGTETEYAKRSRAIANEWLYPVLTLQGYVTPDGAHLLGFAIARTREIIATIAAGVYEVQHTGSRQRGQAEFFVVKWDALRARGHRVYEWRQGGSR